MAGFDCRSNELWFRLVGGEWLTLKDQQPGEWLTDGDNTALTKFTDGLVHQLHLPRFLLTVRRHTDGCMTLAVGDCLELKMQSSASPRISNALRWFQAHRVPDPPYCVQCCLLCHEHLFYSSS